jgi:hypothetical protein
MYTPSMLGMVAGTVRWRRDGTARWARYAALAPFFGFLACGSSGSTSDDKRADGTAGASLGGSDGGGGRAGSSGSGETAQGSGGSTATGGRGTGGSGKGGSTSGSAGTSSGEAGGEAGAGGGGEEAGGGSPEGGAAADTGGTSSRAGGGGSGGVSGSAGGGASGTAGSAGTAGGTCAPCITGLTCGGGGKLDTCGVTIVPRPGQVCSVDGWCVLNPRPQGNDLNDVLALANDDIWAVGRAGTVLHYDGSQWSGITSLVEVDTSSSGGEGEQDASLDSIWASSPQDLWIAGRYGILRGDGEHWNAVTVTGTDASTIYTSVWGTASDDVWVTTRANGVFHFDGATWSSHTFASGVGGAVTAVAGRAANEVYFATGNGVYRWDGTSYTLDRSGITTGVWASAASGVWAWQGAHIYQRIGSTWVTQAAPHAVADVRPISSTTAWVALDQYESSGQSLAYFDGSWTEYPAAWQLNALELVDANELIGVGSWGYTMLRDSSGTTEVGAPSLRGESLAGMSGTGADDLWFAGWDPHSTMTMFAAHFDGSAFSEYRIGSGGGFEAVAALGGDDVWAVAGASAGSIYSFTGSTFAASPSAVATSYFDVWGADPDHVWALPAASAVIYEWAGSAWQPVSHGLSSSTIAFQSLWGRSSNNVWVVGTQGMTMHYDGTTWTPSPTTSSTDKLTGAWGWDDQSLWVSSAEGNIHAWDGEHWTVPFSNLGQLAAICGVSKSSIWVTSWDSPDLQHFDGVGWTKTRPGVERATAAQVLGCIDGEIWATGIDSQILRWSPN